MPRRNRNVGYRKRKRVKHTNASPRTERKRMRTRQLVTDPHSGKPVVAWPRRKAA